MSNNMYHLLAKMVFKGLKTLFNAPFYIFMLAHGQVFNGESFVVHMATNTFMRGGMPLPPLSPPPTMDGMIFVSYAILLVLNIRVIYTSGWGG